MFIVQDLKRFQPRQSLVGLVEPPGSVRGGHDILLAVNYLEYWKKNMVAFMQIKSGTNIVVIEL